MRAPFFSTFLLSQLGRKLAAIKNENGKNTNGKQLLNTIHEVLNILCGRNIHTKIRRACQDCPVQPHVGVNGDALASIIANMDLLCGSFQSRQQTRHTHNTFVLNASQFQCSLISFEGEKEECLRPAACCFLPLFFALLKF
jgi:hypothetical protein